MRVLSHHAAPDGGSDASPGDAGDARLNRGAVIGLGLVAMLLVGAAAVLWMRHGVAIFFDTVVAGLSTCF